MPRSQAYATASARPLPGEIRLQWWRDVIAAKDASAGAGHPVAEALLEAIDRRSLPREAFQNYLDARIFDLYDDPMPTRGDLEGYCGETAAAIIQLSSIVLDPAAAADSAELAGHAGCALSDHRTAAPAAAASPPRPVLCAEGHSGGGRDVAGGVSGRRRRAECGHALWRR